MMRALIVFAFLTSFAQAQQTCTSYAAMVKMLNDQYQEVSVASGLINPKQALEIFASEKGTWTILSVPIEGPTCMLASGVSWSGMNLPGERL